MTTPVSAGGQETVAAVLVTFNRRELLQRSLDALAGMDRRPDAVYVVDNASSDGTEELLAERPAVPGMPLRVLRSAENLGGAGGFSLGMRTAYADGWTRLWLLDDDVVPDRRCLAVLMAHAGPALMVVREDRSGRVVEKSATHFDLDRPWVMAPKTDSVETSYPSRRQMPVEIPVAVVAFEGFLVHRDVVTAVGFPDPAYFVFYDDVDYALRVRAAGFPILALRDAVVVRQLDFDQQHDLTSWKGFYMYRNLFVVHFRFGGNVLVRLKPYLLTVAVVVLSPLRGGRAEARNVLRAIASARKMRRPPT
jgi:GT2 family glycosyltransferase